MDVGDRVGGGGLGCLDPDAARRLSRADVDERGLDAGTADVDTDASVHPGIGPAGHRCHPR